MLMRIAIVKIPSRYIFVLFFVCRFFVVVFPGMVYLCISDSPGSHYVDQASIKLTGVQLLLLIAWLLYAV